MKNGLKKYFRAAKARKVKTVFDEFNSDHKKDEQIEDGDTQLQLRRKRTISAKAKRMSKARGEIKRKVPHLSMI